MTAQLRPCLKSSDEKDVELPLIYYISRKGNMTNRRSQVVTENGVQRSGVMRSLINSRVDLLLLVEWFITTHHFLGRNMDIEFLKTLKRKENLKI